MTRKFLHNAGGIVGKSALIFITILTIFHSKVDAQAAGSWLLNGNTEGATPLLRLGTMQTGVSLPFYAGGVNHMTLGANGNLGIGILNPQAKLDVYDPPSITAGSTKAGISLVQDLGNGTNPSLNNPAAIRVNLLNVGNRGFFLDLKTNGFTKFLMDRNGGFKLLVHNIFQLTKFLCPRVIQQALHQILRLLL